MKKTTVFFTFSFSNAAYLVSICNEIAIEAIRDKRNKIGKLIVLHQTRHIEWKIKLNICVPAYLVYDYILLWLNFLIFPNKNRYINSSTCLNNNSLFKKTIPYTYINISYPKFYGPVQISDKYNFYI